MSLAYFASPQSRPFPVGFLSCVTVRSKLAVRGLFLHVCLASFLQVFFIESICDDPTVVASNIMVR